MKLSLVPLLAAGFLNFVHASSGDFLNTLKISEAANSPWKISGTASFGLTDGNSEALTVALQLMANYRKGKNETTFGSEWLYSEDTGVVETDSFRLHGKYHRLITDHFYLSTHSAYLTDQVADIDYRIDLGSGIGYSLIKNDTTSFSLETGPGIAWQKQGGLATQEITLTFGQSFEHHFSERNRFWQKLAFTPVADDFNHYLLTTEAGFETVLSSHWALRSSLRYRYDSTPAAGRQSDDAALLLGLSYSLGGFEADGSRTAGSIGDGWDHTGALGLSHLSGNSDSSSMTLSAESALRTEKKEIFLGTKYQFSDNDGATSADSLWANAQYNRLTSKHTYLGGSAIFLRDDLAEVNYRITPAAILGRYLIKKDAMTLSIEGGPSFTFEEVGGIGEDYFSFVATEKFTWAFSDRTTFKQSLSANFDASDSDNTILLAESSVEIKLNEKIAWRLATTWSHDNVPAAGREKNDTSLTSGISVKF